MDNLGRFGRGGQVGQHGDLLLILAQKQDRANQANFSHTCLLLKQLVAVPASFEGEPSGLEALRRIPPPRTAALQVGDEANAFGLEETECFPAVAATVENQRERFGPMGAANPGDRSRERAS